MRKLILLLSVLLTALGLSAGTAFAAASPGPEHIDLTRSSTGYAAIVLFVVAYLFVMAEEFTHLRKSKPVIFAAGVIWLLIAIAYPQGNHVVADGVRHNILEFAELFLFLLVAMTYINAMEERQVFSTLRAWLLARGFGFRALFWMTGWLAFFISPVADNLTTALIMCAVVLAVGGGNKKFISMSCINIVVAANAGGAFSPFGDITTLMVWQKGIIEFHTFFLLFLPAVVNFVVPAFCMHFFLPNEKPQAISENVHLKRGARRIIALFLLTITTAVCFHNFLHLPPMVGMMTGLAYLQVFGFYLKKSHGKEVEMLAARNNGYLGDVTAFDVFQKISRAEWDTLLFFYGVVLCVGGLGFIGYLTLISHELYGGNHTFANSMVGLLSAVVDNIPVMFAVLTMQPDMALGQWLLVTLTTGVGGSLLSIGSAAGVALMGQARGYYTFFSHLKWSPVIALGYIASIWVHLLLNAKTFTASVPG